MYSSLIECRALQPKRPNRFYSHICGGFEPRHRAYERNTINEMKLLVSGEEFESPLQESKSCLLPVTTSGSISQRGFSFPSVIYYTTSCCICQYLSDIFLYFKNLSTLQAHTLYRFLLPQDTACSRLQYSGLDLSLWAYPASS